MRPTSRSPRRRILTSLARTATVALTGLATLAAGLVLASPASAGNRVTPGSFTGYGFDQCTAPTQRSMDAWLTSTRINSRSGVGHPKASDATSIRARVAAPAANAIPVPVTIKPSCR